jgi:hypothetical protein
MPLTTPARGALFCSDTVLVLVIVKDFSMMSLPVLNDYSTRLRRDVVGRVSNFPSVPEGYVAAGVALLSFFGDTAGRLTAVGVCMYGWQWFFRRFDWMERWIVETAGRLGHVYLSPQPAARERALDPS